MRLLSDADTRAQMGAIARSRVERYYLKEDVMQHYLEAFKRIQVKRGGSGRPAAATVQQANT